MLICSYISTGDLICIGKVGNGVLSREEDYCEIEQNIKLFFKLYWHFQGLIYVID